MFAIVHSPNSEDPMDHYQPADSGAKPSKGHTEVVKWQAERQKEVLQQKPPIAVESKTSTNNSGDQPIFHSPNFTDSMDQLDDFTPTESQPLKRKTVMFPEDQTEAIVCQAKRKKQINKNIQPPEPPIAAEASTSTNESGDLELDELMGRLYVHKKHERDLWISVHQFVHKRFQCYEWHRNRCQTKD